MDSSKNTEQAQQTVAPASIPGWRRALIIAAGIATLPFLFLIALFMAVLWLSALIALHLLAWAIWLPQGRVGVFVYSNSPNWQRDVEETILSGVSDRLIVLNWSERKRWRNTLAVWCFRFLNFGRQTNYNPMAIIFRPGRPVRTVRFFDAYRDAKHGNEKQLAAKKKQLFELVS